ncbi:hypothetical protein [Enterococcus sp. RIT-PI-f]|uniref:hypothetical protein n=1 Tax=Enterococcus sp. RIT-PI-f TaxID=1690244 RepID=UPI003564ACC3
MREEKHILDYGYRCVLFRKKDSYGKVSAKNFLIADTGFLEVKMYHVGKRIAYMDTGSKTTLKKVQKDIRLVFDRQGILIARRVSPNAPLRLTGKGMGKLVTKKVI